jgi:hypothetical protein
MAPGIVCSLFGIAAHYSNKTAVSHFIKCRTALFFGYIAAAYYSPIDV